MISKTIVFRADRKPNPSFVHIGFETDNMVERLVFVLPSIHDQQTATLMIGGKYVNMVMLSEESGRYYTDLTAELVGAPGRIDAYVTINAPDGKVWNSAPFVLVTDDLPDIDGAIQEHFPDAIQQMRQEIAGHRAEMEDQSKDVQEAADRAEQAAEDISDTQDGGANGQFLGNVNGVPTWMDAPSGSGSGGAVTSVNGKTGNVQLTAKDVGAQPAGDYVLKSELPSVPSKLSELSDDSDHRLTTDREKAAWNAKSEFSGKYIDLEGKPDIPTVPTNVSAFANDAGYLTEHQDLSDYAKKTDIPDTSAFITRAVNDLENYYKKSETYTRDEIDQRISAIPKFSIAVVYVLPSNDISETTIYLVPGGSDGNLYTEYIYVNGTWEILGSQRVDLTGYATQSWTLEQLAGYQPKGNYALKTELDQLSEKILNSDSIIRANFQTIAHRGYHVNAAQNSLQSFIDAAEAGFKWIEMDIRYCKDGIYILSHDPTITAYNNGTAVSVTIADSNYSDIKNYTLDAAGVYPICTYSTALATLRNYGSRIICDRSGGSNAEIMEIAARHGMADRVMLSYQYPGKPFLEDELPVLKKYKTIPIRIVPNHYENMVKAMNELSNPVYADVNASSSEHYQSYLNIAMSCGAPILFSGCTLTDNNKNRWAGIGCGGMANENDNISPEEFLDAITADYATRSNISVSVTSVNVAADGTSDVTASSDLSTVAGSLFAYSRNPLVASVKQTSFGQSIAFTVTGVADGYATEIVVFSPNGEQTIIPVTVGGADATLVYELESPVTFTASGVDQVIDTGYALNEVDRDWTICMEFIPKANINSTLWSCVDETTGSATLSAGHQFRVKYNQNTYYVNGGLNSVNVELTGINPQNDTTTYKAVVYHSAGGKRVKVKYTNNDGVVVSTETPTWSDANNVCNSKTLLLGGRYGTDGNIYGSTTSSLWQGTVNDFRVYERVWSDAEITAYLS